MQYISQTDRCTFDILEFLIKNYFKIKVFENP